MFTPASSVKSLMRWPVAMVGGATSLRQVADALVTDELGALAVVENDCLIGVISERDVVRQVASGADADEVLAADVMSMETVTVAPSATVGEAASLMLEAAVRHLPVLQDEELVGFLSMRDVFEVYRSAGVE